MNRLLVATILTGTQLEDVKEIIKNQNELIKEQASEIVNLKRSLECVLIPGSSEVITPQTTANKEIQCDVLTSDKCSNTDILIPLPPKLEDLAESNRKES